MKRVILKEVPKFDWISYVEWKTGVKYVAKMDTHIDGTPAVKVCYPGSTDYILMPPELVEFV